MSRALPVAPATASSCCTALHCCRVAATSDLIPALVALRKRAASVLESLGTDERHR